MAAERVVASVGTLACQVTDVTRRRHDDATT
jgi:hypothetical protein